MLRKELSDKFTLDSNIILRSEPQYYESYTAYNYKISKTEFLTKDEYRILEFISDKSADLTTLSKKLRVDYNISEKLLNRMIKLGFVRKNVETPYLKSLIREKIDLDQFKAFPVPFLSSPTSVDVFITNSCNYKCVHCFSHKERSDICELSFDDIRSILDQFERLRVLEVRINGGEPFLHQEIDEILHFLKYKRFRKVILTNGSLLDEKNIKLLKESEIIPTVSLDDSNSNDFELFRGAKGSYVKTIDALEQLQKNQVQYGINCCLHKKNLDRYDDIIKLCIKYGAHRIAFLDPKPIGRMKNNLTWEPSFNQYQKSMFKLAIAKAKYKRHIDVALEVFLHCYPLQESIREAKKGYISCQAGKTRLSIGCDGFVYPCNLVIYDKKWRMGKIGSDSIKRIWFSPNWMPYRGGVKIQDLKNCRICDSLSDCQDYYCRLLPYAADNDYFGVHPKCMKINF